MYCNAFGFIPAFANVVQNVWRKVCGVITFGNATLVLLYFFQAPEHTFIVDCHLWQAVPVKEQKLCSLTNNRLCIFPLVQHSLNDASNTFSLIGLVRLPLLVLGVSMVDHVCNLQKLVVYVD